MIRALCVVLLLTAAVCFTISTTASAEQPSGTYTITGAADWRMFQEMLSALKWQFNGFASLIVSLVVWQWHDLKKHVKAQRQKDEGECLRCHKKKLTVFEWIWEAVGSCCEDAARIGREKTRALYSGESKPRSASDE